MDPLEFLTNEELLFFFHRKKTEISCIQQPRRLLTQLRDHDLVPEKLFEKVKKMRSRKQKEKGFYEVLEWLEKNRPQDMHQFWRCVFEDHILQLYPALRKLKNSLLDGTFKLCEEPPDVETLTEEASEGKAEKGKKSYKRKTSKDDSSSEDSDGPDLFSAIISSQKIPDKKLSFCTFKLCEEPPDVETLTEEEREGKAEKGKLKSYKRKTSKDDSSSEDSDDPDLFSAFTPSQKKPDKKPSFSSPVKKGDKQEIWTWPVHETQLPVTCGDKEGTLYRDKLLEGEKCILSQGHWFTPTAFEKFAGKEKCKNWKTSIRCRNITLKKLIEEGHLECPQRKTRKKTCVQKQNTNERFPVSSNKSSSKETGDFQEQRGKGGGTEFRGRVEEEDDIADLSVFQAPSLPVTCVSLTGTLYKDRFALGSRGKCIRTEERWFTLEEFVKQEPTLTDGHWKKDILCHGKTLNFLLKKQILYIHSLLCECVKCSTLKQDVMAQNNDDECYVCRSEGDLVCCDECPRAFHSHCHLPAINGETPGEWICTFCVLRKSQQWCDSNNMSEQEAFNSPVSQYILHCHCLLLCVYREDIQKVFVKDPQQIVSRCSEFITQPMWKLETGVYQTVGEFVSDFQLIFSNCSTFNKDSEFGRMGTRLKRMFEEEFRKIFKIAEVFTPKMLKGNYKDKNKNVYRFVCPYAGQFLCSLTSLVFVMEGEGEVLYNTVSWDPRLLDGLSKTDKSAGPLYDIKCFNGSISRLHLPHCEIFSEEDMDRLSVAHFTNGNVAIMNPLKVTETHVMIDIKDLSIFGLIKRMIFRPSPVVAQVLVFLRPITMREEENILDVHLLPWNVPLSEVKDQHAENTHIKTSSKCCLTPGTQYRLCCQPEGSTVQPATEEFEFNFGPNYHPTFEVFVNVRNKEVKLSLMNSTEGREVWVPRRILLTGQDVDLPVHRQLVASEFVNKHRCPLIQRVSSVMTIADGLRAKGMITPEMYDKIHDTKPRQNKMRALLKALDSGGASVKAEFYRLLKENEPHLVDELDSGPNRPQ
ncbi:uncharacterized protein LOC131536730 isoform X3 [Onychostoma macrolepis]|uniref:uncharacterized protein LOC131536730 isoform X3 n=1 Tax=Onychostoma macrolepis TaxID=369639 RepID=UPI00272C0E70|nr:uncharacterized protein LOC131536730 isoform X3 [Onychostoma macrolepis]